jgi:ADP-ribosylglycohydrolase
MRSRNAGTCGGTEESNNGNGSLMRIMPACLYCSVMQEKGLMTDGEAVELIHLVSSLTHAHIRSQIACGLYYFAVRNLIKDDDTLIARLQKGLDDGFAFYKQKRDCVAELSYYGRLANLYEFVNTDAKDIRSTGYVVDTLEAAVWCLIKTTTLRDALLTAVNLGLDTDTVAVVCGGLAGIYYGCEDIPADWLGKINKRDRIESVCRKATETFG